MEKVTKKKQIEDLQTVVAAQWRQINKLKLHLGRLVDIDWSDEQDNHDEVIAILDSKEPKLKQLDQSVFDGVFDWVKSAAINPNGAAYLFSVSKDDFYTISDNYGFQITGMDKCQCIGLDYDTSDWQNSLIERDKVELTGSDLARAMLERGDKIVLCAVSDTSDTDALEGDIYDAITSYKDGRTNPFESSGDIYMCAVPVNNQGEPLTQSDVGL